MLWERVARTLQGWFGVASVLLLLSVGALYGCEQEGPAERAGKKIDHAVEKAGEKIEETGEKLQDATKGNKSDSVTRENTDVKN